MASRRERPDLCTLFLGVCICDPLHGKWTFAAKIPNLDDISVDSWKRVVEARTSRLLLERHIPQVPVLCVSYMYSCLPDIHTHFSTRNLSILPEVDIFYAI